MNKDKYIVINRKKLEEMIKEFEALSNNTSEYDSDYDVDFIGFAAKKLKENFLLNSTPLNPLLENAIDEGMLIQRTINDEVNIPATRIKNYINNLKIEI